MGTKSVRQRKYIFLLSACAAILTLFSIGCAAMDKHASSTAETMPSPVDESPSLTAENETTASFEQELSRHLSEAQKALGTGNYANAFIELELAERCQATDKSPEVLFLSGLFYADPRNPTGDITRAKTLFQSVNETWADSDYSGQARVLDELLAQLQSVREEQDHTQNEILELKKRLEAERGSVQQLKNLLKKMKEIDLDMLPKEQN